MPEYKYVFERFLHGAVQTLLEKFRSTGGKDNMRLGNILVTGGGGFLGKALVRKRADPLQLSEASSTFFSGQAGAIAFCASR